MPVNRAGEADIGNSKIGKQGQEKACPGGRHECSFSRDFFMYGMLWWCVKVNSVPEIGRSPEMRERATRDAA